MLAHTADFCLLHQPIYVWIRYMWAVMETYCFCNLKQLVGVGGMVLSTLVVLGSSVVWRRRHLTCTGFCAGSRDEFYLAPEYQEHGIVTEKVGFSYFNIEFLKNVIVCSVSRLSVLCRLRLVFTPLLPFSGLQPSSVCHLIKNWQFLVSWRDFSWRWQRGPLLRDLALSQLKKYYLSSCFYFLFFCTTTLITI